MTVTERNNKVIQILQSFYDKAMDKDFVIDESLYKVDLDGLFNTAVWGFREIVLVVLVAMKLNPSYKPSEELYECNPRALFEGPIKEFLIDNRIPHRKSGPLNVAKATQGLNDNWAAQRRPKDAADHVVKIIKLLESSASVLVDYIGVSLLRKLIAESVYFEEFNVDRDPSSDPEVLFYLCDELIHKAPDAGNTPQKISALLLKNYHFGLRTGVVVTGGDDRASVTSTTSKKPGDVNEENPEGAILKVYEITVKPFDIARIRDSYDCLKIYEENSGKFISEVIVVCRPEDCPAEMKKSNLHLCMGSYSYNEITYYYWNISEWIAETLQRMTAESRELFYLELNSYVSDFNTAETVKKLWQSLNEEI
ncbi:MAG: hypothetical protein ACI3XI_01520 [Eubacteriales bacterium]